MAFVFLSTYGYELQDILQETDNNFNAHSPHFDAYTGFVIRS